METQTQIPTLRRLWASAQTGFIVLVSAGIVALASERLYWYWSGTGPPWEFAFAGFWLLGAVYAMPMMVALWVLDRAGGRGLAAVILGGALMAFAVEGIITPVMYEAGPFSPVFPAMFVGWHGVLSFTLFWYVIRRWLLERRRAALTVLSGSVGVLWGMWAATSWLPEQLTDPELQAASEVSLVVLDPLGFAFYAFTVGGALIAGHWLLGRVWTSPLRFGKAFVAIGIGLMLMWGIPTFMLVPWGPLVLAAIAALPGWLLRRSSRTDDRPALGERMVGRVGFVDTLPLILMPAIASALYAGLWDTAPGEETIRTLMELLVFGQVLVGVAAIGWAWRRISVRGRLRSSDQPAPESEGSTSPR